MPIAGDMTDRTGVDYPVVGRLIRRAILTAISDDLVTEKRYDSESAARVNTIKLVSL